MYFGKSEVIIKNNKLKQNCVVKLVYVSGQIVYKSLVFMTLKSFKFYWSNILTSSKYLITRMN